MVSYTEQSQSGRKAPWKEKEGPESYNCFLDVNGVCLRILLGDGLARAFLAYDRTLKGNGISTSSCDTYLRINDGSDAGVEHSRGPCPEHMPLESISTGAFHVSRLNSFFTWRLAMHEALSPER